MTHRQFSLQAVAVATVNATYDWVQSEAKRVLREVCILNARERERRLEVIPPVACAKSDSERGSGGSEGDSGTQLSRLPAWREDSPDSVFFFKGSVDPPKVLRGPYLGIRIYFLSEELLVVLVGGRLYMY